MGRGATLPGTLGVIAYSKYPVVLSIAAVEPDRDPVRGEMGTETMQL